MKYITTIGEHEYNVEVIDESQIIVDGKRFDLNFDAIEDTPVYSLLVDGHSHEAYVYLVDGIWQVLMHGHFYPVLVEDEREKRLRSSIAGNVHHSGEFNLKAPMPGLVVAVPVEEGQEIDKGEVLLILESMKMQNELKSPRQGFVSHLRVKPGDSVEQHQVLMSVVDE
jgi:acetyl/propionyl-CoA carboxylase alpha subunit